MLGSIGCRAPHRLPCGSVAASSFVTVTASPIARLAADLRRAAAAPDVRVRVQRLDEALLPWRAAAHGLQPSDARSLLVALRAVVSSAAPPPRTAGSAPPAPLASTLLDVIVPTIAAVGAPRAAASLLSDAAARGWLRDAHAGRRAVAALATETWAADATWSELAHAAAVVLPAPCDGARGAAVAALVARARALVASTPLQQGDAPAAVATLAAMSASRVRATALFVAAAPALVAAWAADPRPPPASTPETVARAWALGNAAAAYAAQAVVDVPLVDALARGTDVVSLATFAWLARGSGGGGGSAAPPMAPRRALADAVTPLLYRLCLLGALQRHGDVVRRGLAAMLLLAAAPDVAARGASAQLDAVHRVSSAPPPPDVPSADVVAALPPWLRMQLHIVHLGLLAVSRRASGDGGGGGGDSAVLPPAPWSLPPDAARALWRAVGEQPQQLQQQTSGDSSRPLRGSPPPPPPSRPPAARRAAPAVVTASTGARSAPPPPPPRRPLSHVEQLAVDALFDAAREFDWRPPAVEFRTVLGLDVDIALLRGRAAGAYGDARAPPGATAAGFDPRALVDASVPLVEAGCVAVEVDGPWHYAFDVGPPRPPRAEPRPSPRSGAGGSSAADGGGGTGGGGGSSAPRAPASAAAAYEAYVDALLSGRLSGRAGGDATGRSARGDAGVRLVPPPPPPPAASHLASGAAGAADCGLVLDLLTLYRRWLLRSFGWAVVPLPYGDHATHLLDRSLAHRRAYVLRRLASCGVDPAGVAAHSSV